LIEAALGLPLSLRGAAPIETQTPASWENAIPVSYDRLWRTLPLFASNVPTLRGPLFLRKLRNRKPARRSLGLQHVKTFSEVEKNFPFPPSATGRSPYFALCRFSLRFIRPCRCEQSDLLEFHARHNHGPGFETQVPRSQTRVAPPISGNSLFSFCSKCPAPSLSE
jgi:hypothetical protein